MLEPRPRTHIAARGHLLFCKLLLLLIFCNALHCFAFCCGRIALSIVVAPVVAVAAAKLTIVRSWGIKPQQCQHKPIAWNLPLSALAPTLAPSRGNYSQPRHRTESHDKSIVVWESLPGIMNSAGKQTIDMRFVPSHKKIDDQVGCN